MPHTTRCQVSECICQLFFLIFFFLQNGGFGVRLAIRCELVLGLKMLPSQLTHSKQNKAKIYQHKKHRLTRPLNYCVPCVASLDNNLGSISSGFGHTVSMWLHFQGEPWCWHLVPQTVVVQSSFLTLLILTFPLFTIFLLVYHIGRVTYSTLWPIFENLLSSLPCFLGMSLAYSLTHFETDTRLTVLPVVMTYYSHHYCTLGPCREHPWWMPVWLG